MKKFRFAAFALLCTIFCLPAGGGVDTVPQPTPDDHLTVGLTEWFSGDSDAAEIKFVALVDEKTPDPVPYHALALLLSDRHNDYPRVTELYNRHRALALDGTKYYEAVMPLIDKFAADGSAPALLMRARTLQWGIVPPEPVRAMLLLRRAADGGYAQAQRELAQLFENGSGIEQNIAKARQLYSAAAVQGDVFAMKNLAVLLLNAKDSSKSDRENALSLLHEAEAAGLPDAQMILAQMYLKGIGVKKDLVRARITYERAAENGSADAMFTLAMLHLTGEGAEKSPQKALHWLKEAAQRGDANALFRLGVIYYSGESVTADHKAAFDYFKQAAERGNVGAWYNVAWLSKTGDGTEMDLTEAKGWFERAALVGNDRAQVNLGIMYANGEGVEIDFEEASFWLELAKLFGNKDASELLTKIAPRTEASAQDRARRRAATVYKQLRTPSSPVEE